MRATLVLLAALVACRQKRPLSEVPVLGGTEEEEALLRAELEAFEQAIGPDRVQLRFVRLTEEVKNDAIAGSYGLGRIKLDVDSLNLDDALRHELCHALADAEDLVNKPDPLFVELAASVFSTDSVWKDLRRKHYRTAREQRSEALAVFCELGPLGLIGLLDRCPGQSLLSEEVAAWMMEHIYREYPLLPPLTLDPERIVTLQERGLRNHTQVSATTSPGTVWVKEGFDTSGRERRADLYTGELLDTAFEPVPNVEQSPPLYGVTVWESIGWPEGPAIALSYLRSHHLDDEGERLFVYDAEQAAWRTLDEGCEPPDDARLFTADGQVWRSWAEGEVLRWVPLVE